MFLIELTLRFEKCLFVLLFKNFLDTYNKDEEAAGWGDVLLSSPMQGYWVDLYNAMFTFPAYAALIPGNNLIYVTISVHI